MNDNTVTETKRINSHTYFEYSFTSSLLLVVYVCIFFEIDCSDGSLLTSDEIWNDVPLQYRNDQIRLSFITQTVSQSLQFSFLNFIFEFKLIFSLF